MIKNADFSLNHVPHENADYNRGYKDGRMREFTKMKKIFQEHEIAYNDLIELIETSENLVRNSEIFDIVKRLNTGA